MQGGLAGMAAPDAHFIGQICTKQVNIQSKEKQEEAEIQALIIGNTANAVNAIIKNDDSNDKLLIIEQLSGKWASLAAQMVKNLPAMWRSRFCPWDWKIPWRREWLPTCLETEIV